MEAAYQIQIEVVDEVLKSIATATLQKLLQ